MPAETVTIPARLLRDLVWAAESLTNIEAEDGDRTMINEARRALEQQAPRMTTAMLEVDVMIEQSDGQDACPQCGKTAHSNTQWRLCDIARRKALLIDGTSDGD